MIFHVKHTFLRPIDEPQGNADVPIQKSQAEDAIFSRYAESFSIQPIGRFAKTEKVHAAHAQQGASSPVSLRNGLNVDAIGHGCPRIAPSEAGPARTRRQV